MGKAKNYVLSQWSWLIACLDDGRLERSNNLAERSIKPFVIGRKNFQFANISSGACAAARSTSVLLKPPKKTDWILIVI